MFGVWGLLRQLALEAWGQCWWCDERDRRAEQARGLHIYIYACAPIVVTARAVFTFIMYPGRYAVPLYHSGIG
eukprot:SAG11_NODE_2665_length_3116_cov_2.047398_3_plen_73_part_00